MDQFLSRRFFITALPLMLAAGALLGLVTCNRMMEYAEQMQLSEGYVSEVELMIFKRHATPLIEALKAYKADTGAYPDNLEALVPAQLKGIAKPTWGHKEWGYWRSGNKFTLMVRTSRFNQDGSAAIFTDGW